MSNAEFFRRMLTVVTLSLFAACSGGGSGGSGGGGGEPPVVTITTQPVDQSVTAGATATFTVVASNATGYQWQRSTDGGTSFGDISGAAAASYTTPATTTADDNHRFRVVVSGAGATVTSNAAMLTVTASSVSTVLFHRSYNYGAVINLLTIKDDGTGYTWLTTGSDSNAYAALTPTRKIIYRHFSSARPQENGLYAMNVDGSTKTPLVANDGTAIYAGQSESGRILYTSNNVANNFYDLYSVNVDGTGNIPLAATTAQEVYMASAPGDRVIYQSNNALRSVKADGTSDVPLTAGVAGRTEAFSGVDGAGRVVFTSYETYYGLGTGGVYRVQSAGGTATEIALATTPYEFDVAGISRAGRAVIYGQSGSARNRLLDESGVTLVEVASGAVAYLGSTSTGQVIYRREPDGTPGSSIDLYITGPLGTNTVPLAVEPGINENFEYVTDTGRVIYSTTAGLYAVNTDGTNRTTLALNNNVYVVFKAMLGNRVIYEQTEGGTTTYLYAVNLDGSGVIPLVNSGGQAFFSAVTPSGKILFRRFPGSDDLWVVNADGTNPLPLANSGENEWYLATFE